jgi:hypothetical protein
LITVIELRAGVGAAGFQPAGTTGRSGLRRLVMSVNTLIDLKKMSQKRRRGKADSAFSPDAGAVFDSHCRWRKQCLVYRSDCCCNSVDKLDYAVRHPYRCWRLSVDIHTA